MSKTVASFHIKGFNSKKDAEEFASKVNSKVKVNKNIVGGGRYLVDYNFNDLREPDNDRTWRHKLKR
ncbi:MAG TPA: hypothetical protein VMZ91_01555 [Candidatus Paceibacterota bacterium]|nr:hypothetical protein [Candidatus Paceibacterota bacterium]